MNLHSEFKDFPAIVETSQAHTDILQWIKGNRSQTLEKLQFHGAVLLRGFDLVTDQHFDAAVSAFGLPVFTYAGSLSNAVRVNRTDKVFTANEAPADIEIFLHHEMAQTPRYPGKLFFFCEQAPGSGGATPLCRSDLLLSAMKRQLLEFVAHCTRRGLRYTNVMPPQADALSGQGRSWKGTLNCAEVSQAEAKLRELGYNWQWLDDGSLQATTPVLPAIRTSESGTEVFFNQLIAAAKGWKVSRKQTGKSVCFGDGTEIPDTDMHQVLDLAAQFTVDLQWQTGDMVIVDNYLVMHGRRPFTGTRKVLASLAA